MLVDITFEELREKHDAILIATGVYKLRELDDSTYGNDLTGNVQALGYQLRRIRRTLG